MTIQSVEAAKKLAAKNISAEVIDLRTLWPWDKKTVFKSIQKTKNVVIVHEAVRVSGFGAEISATIAEKMFTQLQLPPLRLGAPRIPISYTPSLENEVKITAEQITQETLKHLREGE